MNVCRSFLKYLVYSVVGLVLCCSGCGHRKVEVVPVRNVSHPEGKKKKILVFSSKGGGGHASVCRTLDAYLGSEYEIKVINLFEDVLSSLDPVSMFTFGKANGEDLYNLLLHKNSTTFASFLGRTYGPRRMASCHRSIVRLVTKYVKEEAPDMLLSVIPLVNKSLLEVAKNLSLPFVLLTNDLDARYYFDGLGKQSYDKCICTIAYDDPKVWEFVKSAHFEDGQVRVVGFPVREQFTHTQDIEAIQKEFSLPADKPTVMVLMGAVGSNGLLLFAKRFARIKKPVHVIFCVGRNEQMPKKLAKIKFPEHVTITVVGFTQKVAELMAASDLLLTKTGANSFNEGIAMSVPMLLDRTKKVMQWERYNIEVLKKYNFGGVISHFYELEHLLDTYLFDRNKNNEIRKNMQAFYKPNFKEEINKLLVESFGKAQR